MSKVTLYLSDQPAPAPWGKNASLSYNADSITIHFKSAQKCEDIQKAARKLEGQNFYDLKLTGEHWDQESLLAFWLGFRAQKSYAKAKISWPKLSKQEKVLFDKKVEIIDWVRETINLPSDVITPEVLANKAIDLLQKQSEHLSVKLISGEQLKEQQMMGIYSVGKGSENPAVFAEIDFNPTKDEKAPVTASLVGKGITFDSGGYSLKPSSFMLTMRSDMGGAALLTGSLALAIANGLNKRVKLYLCCAENMVSGQAFKLGDIIHYRNGVSVEIGNTDAEGRLVLADGLISASNDNPKYIIDCATLTGAAKVAVGNDYHSVYSFDDAFTNQLFNSATVEKERFWRLPLADFHRSQIPSSFADIDNSGSANTAGGSTAAAFLSYFVKNYQQNWIHIDCSATFQKSATGLWATGATGIGVKTLAHLLNQLK